MRKVKNVAAMFAAVEAAERGFSAPAVGAPFAFGSGNYSFGYTYNNAHMGTHTHTHTDAHEAKKDGRREGDAPRVDVVFDFKHKGSDELGKPGTVWVRVNAGRTKRSYYSTGVRVLPCQWMEGFGVVGRPDAVELNEKIKALYEHTREMVAEEVMDAVSQGQPACSVDIKAKETRKKSGSATFLDFMRQGIEDDDVSDDTKRQSRSQLAKLEEWGQMKRFEDVNADKLHAFFAWCRTKTVGKKVGAKVKQVPVCESTVANAAKAVRKFIRKAQDKGHIGPRALRGVVWPREQESNRVALSDAEVNAWLNFDSPLPHLCNARDRFIVQMASGVDYSTLMDVDWSQREMIDGKMTIHGTRVKGRQSHRVKTKKFFLVVLPMAWEILERWDWKIPPITDQKYNEYLLKIETLLELKKHVTSHVARHTYACLCLRHGIRLESVQKTLGHSNIRTTQRYAKMVDQDVLDSFDDFKDRNGITAKVKKSRKKKK